MAERPKTQTSTSTTSATPDATAPIPSAAAVSVDVHVPAHTSRGYVVERHDHSDWVQADEIIAAISTDKIDTDVEAPATGRVQEVLVDVGTTVDVGKHQAYHACIRSITRAILATPRRDR